MHKYRTNFILLVVLMCFSLAGNTQDNGISLGKKEKTVALQDSLPIVVADTLAPVVDSLLVESKPPKTT